MFARIEELSADLDAFAVDKNRAHVWEPQDDLIGGALIRISVGKVPSELRERGIESITPQQQYVALRFVTEFLLGPDSDYYTLLGARRESSAGQLRKNYQRLIALVHPDSAPIGVPPDAASRVNKAYATLTRRYSVCCKAARRLKAQLVSAPASTSA
jgi:DnaJ domain